MQHIIWSTGHEIKFDDIVKAENCFLFNSKGNKLIDLESGVWCTSVGHNNKRVNNIISSQMNKITHTGFCYCHPQIDKTAQKLLEITGIIDGKCEFLSSGSEAVEYGLRLARTISSKPLAITFSDSYFGAYGDAAAKDPKKWHVFNWLDCGCKDPNGCDGSCEDFEKIPFEKIGIFLFEPGSSSGLVRFPSKKLISKVVGKVKENQGVVLCNEITTGMGRTGKWFGYQHYGISPDIVAMGKGLGNGYPVSATAVAETVINQLSSKVFRYAQSHQNDPLGACVAIEVIHIIEQQQLLVRCCEMGQYLLEGINHLIHEKSIVKAVRGRGLMLAIEFKVDAGKVYETLLKKGFIVAKRPGTEVLRIDPALTIETASIDAFLNALAEIVLVQKEV